MALTLPWSFFFDTNVSAATNSLQLLNAKQIMKALIGNDDMFYTDALADHSAFDKIITYLTTKVTKTGKSLALWTQYNYLSAICKYLSKVPDIDTYTLWQLQNYYQELRGRILTDKETIMKDYTPFPQILQKLPAIIESHKYVIGFRVLCSMILHNIHNIDTLEVSDNEIGVLRPSDLQRTTFTDNGTNSFIDLDAKLWHIRSNCTKNRDERLLTISDEFVADIRKIFGSRLATAESLLLNKYYKPYTSLESLYIMFRKHIGVNFNGVRSSYEIFRAENITISEQQELCKKMGHSQTTSLTSYITYMNTK